MNGKQKNEAEEEVSSSEPWAVIHAQLQCRVEATGDK
jgi:hypothetical protein